MRGEVPGGIHIQTNGPRICTDRRNVVQLTEMASIEIFFHLAYPRVVKEDVADHED
jgi:hypothetical protein